MALSHLTELTTIVVHYVCPLNDFPSPSHEYRNARHNDEGAYRFDVRSGLDVDQFENLVLGLYRSYAELKELVLREIGWCVLSDKEIEKYKGAYHRKIRTVVGSLHTLRLYFNTGKGFKFTQWAESKLCRSRLNVSGNRLYEIIKAASQLQHLTIHFDQDSRESPISFPVSLRYLVQHHKWDRLETVELAMIDTTEIDMVNFLSLHRETLRGLKLKDIFMEDGDWISTLDGIQVYSTSNLLSLKDNYAFEWK